MTESTHHNADRAARGSRAAAPAGSHQAGFTLVEVTIILLVLAVLSMILLPSIGGYIRDARLARARSDMVSIELAILAFLEDTAEGAFRCYGNGNRATTDEAEYSPSSPKPWFVVGMLVSDGDTPDTRVTDDASVDRWRWPVDGHAVDTLVNHLVQNTPGDLVSARYRTPEDLLTGSPSPQFALASQQGFNARFAWRGPYLSAPVRSDPWGNRYAVNVMYLDAVADSDGVYEAGHIEDVFVLSAGPDEELDTPFAIDGVVPGDDDLIRVIAGGSR